MLFRRLAAICLFVAALGLLWLAFSDMTNKSPRHAKPLDATLGGSGEPYAPRDWSVERLQADSRISAFVFRDRNRNGEYDLGDLPMAAVEIELERPDGGKRVRSSNINGYTNFSMSRAGGENDIWEAGEAHDFRVRVPPGFIVTTNNIHQSAHFRHVPGSIGGLVADNPPTSIGLAPQLTVRGRIESIAATHLTASTPSGGEEAITIQKDGQFDFEAGPGDWLLTIHDTTTDRRYERRITILDAPVTLSAIRPRPNPTEPATSTRIEDFEYLHRASIDKIPNGHAGLNWDYLLAVDNQIYRGPGYVNSLISGRAVAYNSSGHPVTISARPGERFDFDGAYFGVAWPGAEGETLHIEAWRGGERVAQDRARLSHLGPLWFAADYRGIDRLTLTTEHYWQFVTDDMRLRFSEP